ncbi:cell division protein FtsL [Uliginosibacterium sp. H3]|uniref:Cell division protein FtsL n=1 Tax=Uliginosibacterium silvisoli TaxID=3114758 RepID=A0ABU6K2L7_9RHOO|nr:cell division protein FtsL [Uliginosibacterium sp. H3]
MIRIAAILVVLAVLSALSVVHLQYQSRKLVTLQEREQVHTRALEAEWTQLQLENSTWAAPARVEKIARERLGMLTPAHDALVSVDYSSGGAR